MCRITLNLDVMWLRRIGTPLALLLLSAVDTTAQEAAPDERTLAALLGRELSAAAVDENGWTDLHHAAVLNLATLAATLLDADAAPDAALRSDHAPFSDRLQAVLAALGRDTFGKTHRYGQTPLHLATREGSHDATALLIDHEAAVNAKDAHGNTPLHHAAHALRAMTPLRAAVRTLLALGAGPRVRNDDGLTYEEVIANEVKSIEEFAVKAALGLCRWYRENNFPPLEQKVVAAAVGISGGGILNLSDLPPSRSKGG